MTQEEKLKRIEGMRLINDVFFEVAARDKGMCEEILRTIIGDPNLVVEDVITQCSERNLYGRSVRLDALCILGNGTRCNIEVQRADNDDHLRRMRFNAASITVNESNPGERFGDVIEVYIVYISEKDILGKGKTMYHIDKTIRETGEIVDDGLHEILVNAEISDGSDVSELMSCFLQDEVKNAKFPRISARVNECKTSKGERTAMCKIVEEIVAQERIEERVKVFLDLFLSGDISKEKAAQKLNMSVEHFLELAKQEGVVIS